MVVDVDYFALENIYELNYDPPPDQVVALVNIGARYSSINILKGGRSVFTGDVPVGGRDITEALMRDLGVRADEAERSEDAARQPAAFRPGAGRASRSAPAVDALIEEIHHALSFFWTAATDERIDMRLPQRRRRRRRRSWRSAWRSASRRRSRSTDPLQPHRA